MRELTSAEHVSVAGASSVTATPTRVSHVRARSSYGRDVAAARGTVSRGSVVSLSTIRSAVVPAPPPYMSQYSMRQSSYPAIEPVDEEIMDAPVVVERRRGGSQVETWVNEVTRRRRESVASSSTSSSPLTIGRVRADPRKYQMYKLYPMHDPYFVEFMSEETPGDRDWKRYWRLAEMRHVISELKRDGDQVTSEMTRYFFSVIKVHNSALSSYTQAKSAHSPTFVQKVFSQTKHQDFLDVVKRSSGFLHAFQLENYFVGYDERAKHSGLSSYAVSPDSDGTARTGEFYLAIGPQRLRVAVSALKEGAAPVYGEDDRVLSCAWAFGRKILSVRHSYDNGDGTLVCHPGASGVVKEDDEVDLVLFDAKTQGFSYFPVDVPIPGSEVIVVAHDVFGGTLQVHGPFTISGDVNLWFIDHAFDYGFSGAVIFDPKRSVVVGLYVGLYMETEDKVLGRVAPVKDFLEG